MTGVTSQRVLARAARERRTEQVFSALDSFDLGSSGQAQLLFQLGARLVGRILDADEDLAVPDFGIGEARAEVRELAVISRVTTVVRMAPSMVVS